MANSLSSSEFLCNGFGFFFRLSIHVHSEYEYYERNIAIIMDGRGSIDVDGGTQHSASDLCGEVFYVG